MGYDTMIEIIEEEIDDVGSEPTVPSEGEQTVLLNHALMNNLDTPNQHPITAIIGLQDKLAEIEKLDVVYSDKKNIADFYAWEDWTDRSTSPNRFGYFVSICEDANKIKLCTGGEPFGVIVESAGFVGGQTNLDATTDHRYALVAHSGLVTIRCEVGINVGDFVMPNEYGYAKKDDDNYGYQVIARKNIGQIPYAVISFNGLTSYVGDIKRAANASVKRIEELEAAIIKNTSLIIELSEKIAKLEEYVQNKGYDDEVDVATLNYYNSNNAETSVKTKWNTVGNSETFVLVSPTELGWAIPNGYEFSHWVVQGQGTKLVGETVEIKIGETLDVITSWKTKTPTEDTHTHHYTSVVITDPTCTEEGEVMYMCDCGDSYTRYIQPTGHTPGEYAVEEMYCDISYITQRCTACGEVLDSKYGEGDGVSHSWDGYTDEGHVCSRCEAFEAHDKVFTYKDATCSTEGSVKTSCRLCNYSKTDYGDIDPNNHVGIAGYESNKDGSTHTVHCSCGDFTEDCTWNSNARCTKCSQKAI